MKPTPWALVFGAWLVAAVSTLGALFLSEVMYLPPCLLCWYQRVFMFPLVAVLAVGLFPFDRTVVRYAMPLALAGWLVAVAHVLLMAGLIPEAAIPCTQGVPCSRIDFLLFGFLTLPMLSAVAFSAIGALLAAAHYSSRTDPT